MADVSARTELATQEFAQPSAALECARRTEVADMSGQWDFERLRHSQMIPLRA
jgi:hypothetical protein